MRYRFLSSFSVALRCACRMSLSGEGFPSPALGILGIVPSSLTSACVWWAVLSCPICLSPQALSTEVTTLVGESYERAYPKMFMLELLAKMQEMIEFKQVFRSSPIVGGGSFCEARCWPFREFLSPFDFLPFRTFTSPHSPVPRIHAHAHTHIHSHAHTHAAAAELFAPATTTVASHLATPVGGSLLCR